MADGESVAMEMADVELPPGLEQFRAKIRADRKALLRDPAFQDPAQLRQFMALYMLERMDEMVRIFGIAFMDSYGLAASNTNQLRRLHTFVVDELNELGADIEDSDLPGVSTETLESFQQAFYGLGTYLQAKYPQDKELEKRFNLCAELVAAMVEELMMGGDESRAEDDDRGGDEDDGPREPTDEVAGEAGDGAPETDGGGDD